MQSVVCSFRYSVPKCSDIKLHLPCSTIIPSYGVLFYNKSCVLLIFQILVPIANVSEEMEAVMIIDIPRRAKENVVVASIGDNILKFWQGKLVTDIVTSRSQDRHVVIIVCL